MNSGVTVWPRDPDGVENKVRHDTWSATGNRGHHQKVSPRSRSSRAYFSGYFAGFKSIQEVTVLFRSTASVARRGWKRGRVVGGYNSWLNGLAINMVYKWNKTNLCVFSSRQFVWRFVKNAIRRSLLNTADTSRAHRRNQAIKTNAFDHSVRSAIWKTDIKLHVIFKRKGIQRGQKIKRPS